MIHEYQLTPHSLYAAVSVGIETETIIKILEKLSKVFLADDIKDFIRKSTENYGKADTRCLYLFLEDGEWH